MPESVRQNLVKFVFADVPERSVSQVVSERYGLGEVFVQVEGARDGARDLADFESVGEAGNIVVAERRDENLGLVLEAAECLAVDDSVAVALVFGADVGGRFGDGASGGLGGLCGEWGEVLFALLKAAAD